MRPSWFFECFRFGGGGGGESEGDDGLRLAWEIFPATVDDE